MSGDTWHDDTWHVTLGIRTCVIVTHVGHMASHVSTVCKVIDKIVGEEISLRKKSSQEEKKKRKEKERGKRKKKEGKGEKKERKEREKGRFVQFSSVLTIGTRQTKK